MPATFIVPAPGDLRAILINNGAEATNSSRVDLILSAQGATEMLLGTDEAFTGSVWEPYVTAKSFFLADEEIGPGFGDGTKTVFVKFRNIDLNESDVFSASILLDTTPPVVGAIPVLINDGALETDSRQVTLTLSATGATSIVILNEIQLEQIVGVEQPFSTTVTHTLSEENGQKEVFVNFIDDIGNDTGFFSARIILTGQPIGDPVIIEPPDETETTDHFITVRGTSDPGVIIRVDIDEDGA